MPLQKKSSTSNVPAKEVKHPGHPAKSVMVHASLRSEIK